MKKLAGFICETRSNIDLVKIINEHLKFLPSDIDLFIYHGRNRKIIREHFPNAKLRELPGMNENYYNTMLTSIEFWEKFLNYEKVLIFQHDSAILRQGIEEFLRMPVDYLGAPWMFPPYRGNGGLSLRTPKIMYEICKNLNWNITLSNEDVAICNYMNRNNIGKLASIEECEKFACESIFKLGSWGIHAIDKHLTIEQCNKIKNQYK